MKPLSKSPPLGKVHVQSVLYGNAPDAIARAKAHLERAADIAIAGGIAESVSLVYGDCSPTPALQDAVETFHRPGSAFSSLEYRFFGANLGSACGHNTLFQDARADYVLIMNPDIMVAPNVLTELARPFLDGRAGMVEAKQLPVEHPKHYDTATGETSWAATACALLPAELLERLGGFDDQTFFLYCDDVDLSWRIRLAGRTVVYQPSASVFHDKALGARGAWIAGEAERRFSAEAALLLAYKYDRDDIVASALQYFQASDEPHLRAAAEEFGRRQARGELPRKLENAHKVASFIDGAYSRHRFAL